MTCSYLFRNGRQCIVNSESMVDKESVEDVDENRHQSASLQGDSDAFSREASIDDIEGDR